MKDLQERTDQKEEKEHLWFTDIVKGTFVKLYFFNPSNPWRKITILWIPRKNAKFNSHTDIASKLSHTLRFRFSSAPSASPQESPWWSLQWGVAVVGIKEKMETKATAKH